MSSSEDSDNEPIIIIRNQRIYRPRMNYGFMENTYKFNERFRMAANKFYNLVEILEPNLERQTQRSKALSARLQVEITLHWMGTGAQYHAIADMHGVSKGSVCRAVHGVVNSVTTHMFRRFVKWPDNAQDVVQRFHALGGMPMVCGCVDGTLINIDAPTEYEPAYVDRHGKHSINAMVVCGPNYEFYYSFANWPGSVHDARVLRTSGLHARMENGWRPIPNGIILGDSAYPLKEWLIPPVVRNNDDAEARFLRSHKATRRVIENAIGILKEKFPCLNHLRLSPNFACHVFNCCVTLYNFLRSEEDYFHERLPDVHDEDDQNDLVFEEELVLINAEEKLQNIIRHFRR